jgi:hydrogenase maturation factor HypF (carbamoyltransferase family)
MMGSPDESTMDYMQPNNYDDEVQNLFATYMHPPMVLAEDTKAMTSSWQQQQQQQQQQYQPHHSHSNSNSQSHSQHHSRGDSLQSSHSFDSDMHNF